MSDAFARHGTPLGLMLLNGCLISHGPQGSNVKRPFANIPGLEMHEMSTGTVLSQREPPTDSDSTKLASAFHGQFGFIAFTTTHRLPRHVHIAPSDHDPDQKLFVTERILVLNGVALVELNGDIYIIPPGSLVTIAPGVPHTWNACPAGLKLPDGTSSEGTFLMVYEYEKPTAFFATQQKETLRDVRDYQEFGGDLESIRFPDLSAREVVGQGTLVWGKELRKAALLSE